MRKKSNLCPNCKVSTEPTWKFCLACGEVLIEDVVEVEFDPSYVSPRQEKAYKKGKVRCWQCNEKLKEHTPACPTCGADLLNPKDAVKKFESVEPKGVIGNLPMWMILAFALMGVVTLAGLGYSMYMGGNKSEASENAENGGFKLPSLPDIDFGSLFGDSEQASPVPDGIPSAAVEGRAISVSDDGLIVVRINGHDIDVRLAGVPEDFASECQGDKGLARVKRILSTGAVVYLHLDQVGRLVTNEDYDTQSVYIWEEDPGTGKVRFVNEEVLAGGEAGIVTPVLTDFEPAADLIAAAQRAKDKERGRFAPGACS